LNAAASRSCLAFPRATARALRITERNSAALWQRRSLNAISPICRRGSAASRRAVSCDSRAGGLKLGVVGLGCTWGGPPEARNCSHSLQVGADVRGLLVPRRTEPRRESGPFGLSIKPFGWARGGREASKNGPRLELLDRNRKGGLSMKHVLTGVAVVATLAFSAPVWGQISPGGNSMGQPGPNPGGPGLTPYTTGPGQAPPYYPPPAAPMAPAATGTPPSSSYTPSAPPPSSKSQRHPRTYRKGATSADNSANQLNRQELGRLQAQNYPNLPPRGYAAPPPQPYYPMGSYAPPPQPYYPMGGYAPPPQPYYPMGTTGGGAPYRP
jgi:hypothetical protein